MGWQAYPQSYKMIPITCARCGARSQGMVTPECGVSMLLAVSGRKDGCEKCGDDSRVVVLDALGFELGDWGERSVKVCDG